MTVYLIGHSYEFAVVEGVTSLMGRAPDKVVRAAEAAQGGDCIVSRLEGGRAHAAVTLDGKTASAEAFVQTESCAASDRYLLVGAEQRAVKKALFAALSQFVPCGPWGALSGMRPAKLAAKLMGGGAAAAENLLISDYYVAPDKARLCVECARRGMALADTLDTSDVALYVGIPFCPTRCSYCSFVSRTTGAEGALIEPYLDALAREMERRADELQNRRAVMAYVGGGTPTVLSAAQLDRLLRALGRLVPLSSLRELTVEAGRPDTLTAEKLAVLARGGVTRIAINPQSMDDAVLRAAGRGHTAQETRTAFYLAREMGFTNINMDLIAGLPSDTPRGFAASCDAVIALGPENITVHTLARKRGAAAVNAPNSESIADVSEMVEYASQRLLDAGYAPYYVYRQKYAAASLENVGWTLPEKECLYNIAAMEELCDTLAFGAGGISKYREGTRITRRANKKYPREYIAT